MSKAIEQRVKELLKNIEKKEGIVFNRLLDTLFLERILVRISKSKYKDKLIFKGGMCLAQFLDLGRGTRDIDFLLNKLSVNENSLKAMFEEIISIDCKDGFVFNEVTVGQLSLEHKKYPGYRISMVGKLEQIKTKVTVDVGVGDVVRPKIVEIKLLKAKDSIFEETIELTGYPAEYIFSEKLEAILHIREINGRMKDYYDCFKLIKEKVLEPAELKIALKDTFETRGTEFELIPIEFKDGLDTRWKAFLKKEKLSQIFFESIIQGINDYLRDYE